MRVRDIMTEDPQYVEASDSIYHAIELLNELDVRHLPVVSGGEVIGMISDRDIRNYDLPLVTRASEEDEELKQILVSSVMTSDSYCLGPEEEIGEIIRLMIDQKFGAVPVVDPIDGDLVGIVSYIDVLRAFEEYLDE